MAVNVRTLPNEKVDVDIVGDSSAFGDVRVSEITPLCGWTFAYGGFEVFRVYWAVHNHNGNIVEYIKRICRYIL